MKFRCVASLPGKFCLNINIALKNKYYILIAKQEVTARLPIVDENEKKPWKGAESV